MTKQLNDSPIETIPVWQPLIHNNNYIELKKKKKRGVSTSAVESSRSRFSHYESAGKFTELLFIQVIMSQEVLAIKRLFCVAI